ICHPQKRCNIKGFLCRNAFVLLNIAYFPGFALRSSNVTARDVKYFFFPGELLIQMLKCLVLPLIISSMSSVKRNSYGKIGLWALYYYTMTSLLAVLTGIVLVVLIQAGKSSSNASATPGGGKEALRIVDALLDLISRNMFPSNLVATCFRQVRSEGDRSFLFFFSFSL
uniref:Amino acid transporter n=1 Tax=Mola mola TaxID=94237 RepID=A0A3Q3XFL2_MOLML